MGITIIATGNTIFESVMWEIPVLKSSWVDKPSLRQNEVARHAHRLTLFIFTPAFNNNAIQKPF